MWISKIQQHATWGGGTTDDNNKDTFTTKHTKTNHTLIHKSSKLINHHPLCSLHKRGFQKHGQLFYSKSNKSNYESSRHIQDSEEKGKKQYPGSLRMPISITSPFGDARKYKK